MLKVRLPGLLLLGFIAASVCAEPPVPLPDGAAPQVVLDAMQSRWKSLKDYSCTMITKVSKGEKTERTTVQYSFKAPDLWRSKVLEGADKGSVAAHGTDGRIRANAGGMLSAITITMEPSDARLGDVRGASIADADLGTQLKEFIKRGEAGWTFERLADTTLPDGAGCIMLQASGPADKNGETREVFYVEKERLILRASKTYEGEKVVDDTIYKDLTLDTGLAADFFKL